jgi:hypothetical protein
MSSKLIFYAILAVLVNIFDPGYVISAVCLFGIVLINYFFIKHCRAAEKPCAADAW